VKVGTLLLLAVASVPARAQPATGDAAQRQAVFSTADAAILGAAGVGSSLLVRYDVRILAWKGLAPFRASPRTRATLDGVAFIGGPGSLAIEAALCGAGRAAKDKNLATDGEAALEAAFVSGAVTYLLKGIVGRARPALDSARADDFGLGRGFSGGDYQSFPSGHTALAFAFATGITARLAQRNSPAVNWAAPTLFSVAALTGIQRVYRHAHWASDCLMGAAIGTVSGLAAARWHERHP
jgi:membrane-associated phospholipid phosphatase